MEDILAIILIFGGGTAIAIAFSPVGKAIADRIRGHGALAETDPAVLAELDDLRGQVSELQERVDFTERLLAKERAPGQLGAGEPS
jgi:hypothetical protein